MQYNNYAIKSSNSMAKISVILGILSVASCFLVITSVIFSSLGILFAILSRGGTRRFDANAKFGIAFSIAGFIVMIVLVTISIMSVIEQFGSFENYLRFYMNDLQYLQNYFY